MHKLFYSILILCILSSGLFISCQKDIISQSDQIDLSFSLDTLRFDTVFTEAGSATRSFKIFNNMEEAVIVNNINLENGISSFFRMNADGIDGKEISDIRIEANDSIYVFVEVTIDPDNPLSISPFIIEEYVNIRANNSNYQVLLEAWGQNANYIPNRQSKGRVSYLSCDFGEWVWDDPRPYVLYGVLVIDSCQLVLPPGTEVFVHGGIAINELGVFNDGLFIFLDNGSIKAQGTPEEPIYFGSDRLETEFDQVQGQWTGILLSAGSTGNEINNTTIEHSIVGVSVDSAAALRFLSSTVAYTSGSGIAASHGSIYAENSLFFQNGGSGLNLNHGGSYIFNYCTFANYNNQDPALSANNIKCLDENCTQLLVNNLNAKFSNCIFVGNDNDEISFFDFYEGTDPNAFQYQFDHCIVSVDELLDADQYPNFFDHCLNCENISRTDTLFLNVDENLYTLDTMSIALDKAKVLQFIDKDRNNNPRDNMPDIGCFELQL